MTKPKGLSPAEIKFKLAQRRVTFAELDRQHELPAGTCRNAARRPHQRGEEAIAEALRMRPRSIWPDRYRADGSRIVPQPADNYRPRPTYGHRQKEARA